MKEKVSKLVNVYKKYGFSVANIKKEILKILKV